MRWVVAVTRARPGIRHHDVAEPSSHDASALELLSVVGSETFTADRVQPILARAERRPLWLHARLGTYRVRYEPIGSTAARPA